MSNLQADLASLRLDRNEPPSSPSPRKGLYLWVLAALAILLASLWFWSESHSSPHAVRVVKVQRLTGEQLASNQSEALLSSSGYIVARRKAVVSAKIQGRLAKLHVEEGVRVNEGDMIAELENADAQAQLARAQASLTEARAAHARAQVQRESAEISRDEMSRQLRWKEKLRNSKVTSEDDVEAAQSKLKLAEADLRIAQASLDQAAAGIERANTDIALQTALFNNTLIRAPFSGTVVKKMAEVGESVAPIPPGVNISTATGAIVALADLDTLEIETDVSEANVSKIQEKQPAQVMVEAFPEKTYAAVLRQILPTADRTKATVQVKVTILDKDPQLKPEMSARVTFLRDNQAKNANASNQQPSNNVITIPQNTVVNSPSGNYVFEVQENRVRKIPVVTRPGTSPNLIVEQGLAGSETLVIQPPANMNDGDTIDVVP